MSIAERTTPQAPEPTLRQEIAAVAEAAETKRAAGLDALKVVQKRFGYISDEHLAEVAALLDMTPAELDGVATF